MKKIFSTVLAVLLLIAFPLNTLAQEDTSTSTTDDETASTDDTSTTDSEELTSTSEDESASTTDEATSAAESSTDETAEESSSFLDNIDTIWLWVILGVGGVVLIGSLIGIISLSKKEKKEGNTITQEPVNTPTAPVTNVETASTEEEKEETVQQKQEINNEVPVTPVINEIKPEEVVPSIKDTLGEASSYQQPETNEQVVSNIAPATDINKDLADLNTAVQQTDKEPGVSNINNTQAPTETISAQTVVLPEMQGNAPVIQEQVSTPNPQNQESPVINENPVNESFNQPINPTSL